MVYKMKSNISLSYLGGLVIASFFLIGATVAKAQDELIPTRYSNDGKSFQALKQPVSIILDNTKGGKAEFKFIQAKKLSLDGFLDECRIVKSSVANNVLTEVRKLIVAEKGNQIKHEFSLTIYSKNNTPFKFSLSSIRNKKVFKTYQGEI